MAETHRAHDEKRTRAHSSMPFVLALIVAVAIVFGLIPKASGNVAAAQYLATAQPENSQSPDARTATAQPANAQSAAGDIAAQRPNANVENENAGARQLEKERKRAWAARPIVALPGEAAIRAETKTTNLDLSSQATGDALSSIPEDKDLSTFVAYGSHDKPKLDDTATKTLKKAIRKIEDADAECSAVLVDLRTGCGIAYNAGKTVYTASAFKAPFVLYLMDVADEEIDEGKRDDIEAAIRYSSNEAYDSIALSHSDDDYIDWQESYGIEYHSHTPYYPFASAASMTRIWADLYQYLKSDSKDAKWLSGLLKDTSRSFIREAVAGKGVTVLNKAGWIADDEYEATTDCAYIEAGDRPYLMTVLTSQPYSQTAAERTEALANALFDARELLR